MSKINPLKVESISHEDFKSQINWALNTPTNTFDFIKKIFPLVLILIINAIDYFKVKAAREKLKYKNEIVQVNKSQVEANEDIEQDAGGTVDKF